MDFHCWQIRYWWNSTVVLLVDFITENFLRLIRRLSSDTTTHLYQRMCPSARQSVPRYFRLTKYAVFRVKILLHEWRWSNRNWCAPVVLVSLSLSLSLSLPISQTIPSEIRNFLWEHQVSRIPDYKSEKGNNRAKLFIGSPNICLLFLTSLLFIFFPFLSFSFFFFLFVSTH